MDKEIKRDTQLQLLIVIVFTMKSALTNDNSFHLHRTDDEDWLHHYWSDDGDYWQWGLLSISIDFVTHMES